jgi:hypothetical protein
MAVSSEGWRQSPLMMTEGRAILNSQAAEKLMVVSIVESLRRDGRPP